MADEIKTEISVTENEEFEVEPASFYEDDDAEWDNVKWDFEEEREVEGEDIDGDESEEAHHADVESAEDDNNVEEEKAKETGSHHEKISVVHNHENVEVDFEEAKPLIQKGLNYDKILNERNSLKEALPRYQAMEAFLEEIKGEFKTIEELMDDTRASILERDGASREEALAKAKERRAPAKKESGGLNVDEFVSRYPKVKASDIPQSVWDRTRENGGNLLAAYTEYEIERSNETIANLRAEIEALKQNKENEERSSGSRRTAGSSNGKSVVQALWDADD